MTGPHDDPAPPKPPVTHLVGEALDAMSVEELRERIAALREEIARLDAAVASKSASLAAADAFFKR